VSTANTSTTSSTTSTTTTPSTILSTPKAPAATLGGAAAIVEGEAVSTAVSRSENKLTAKLGDVSVTLWGASAKGDVIALDADGNIRLNVGEQVVFESSGFMPQENVEVWMYSTPTRLGVITADTSGRISGRFDLPDNIQIGNHRIVLDGKNAAGKKVTLGFGVAIGELESASLLSRLLISIPVALAIIVGLVIPTTLRRRRRVVPA